MELIHLRSIGFPDDVFFARTRPGTTEVLLNHGSVGVRLVDCASGEPLFEIAYPSGVEDFSPYAVLISPRGEYAYMFGSDLEDFAVEFALTTKRSRILRLSPAGSIFTSAGWFNPDLNVADVGHHIWSLEGDVIAKKSLSKPASPRGKALIDICNEYAVQKMDGTATGVYVFGGNDKGETTAGRIALDGAPALLAPQQGDAISLAHFRETILICYEDRIDASSEGRTETLLKKISGERFLAVETLEANGPILALLTDAKETPNGPRCELRVFRIAA